MRDLIYGVRAKKSSHLRNEPLRRAMLHMERIAMALIDYPIQTHTLHRFGMNSVHYVADIAKMKCFEISELVDQILNLCGKTNRRELVESLVDRYSERDIEATLDQLEIIAEQGFIFQSQSDPVRASNRERPRIFVPDGHLSIRELSLSSGGAVIAMSNILAWLSKYADIVVPGTDFLTLAPGITEIPLDINDSIGLHHHFLHESCDGILLWVFSKQYLWFRSISDVPIICRLDSFRGDNNGLINEIHQAYAATRACDAFVTVSRAGKDFYSKQLLDPSCFHVIPNAVDTELFRPMDRIESRKRVAETVGDTRIASERPIVGFFSRFQVEKGSGIFLQVAKLLPDVLFLVIAPCHACYSKTDFPENVLYAGQFPRNELPLFINCFDYHCFPSVIDEESYSLAVLEAMACGVPPIVPRMSGLPEVVEDGGILVECDTYDFALANFAASLSPYRVAEAIQSALSNPQRRETLRERCLKKARSYTWDDAARAMLRLFEQLNCQKNLRWKMNLPVRFADDWDPADRTLQPSSLVLNCSEWGDSPLIRPSYRQSMLEGLALRLLRSHTLHEVEAVLLELCDRDEAKSILDRIRGFVIATS